MEATLLLLALCLLCAAASTLLGRPLQPLCLAGRATMRCCPAPRAGKSVALCFLSYGDIVQRAAWSSWLSAATEAERFAVFLHRADGGGASRLPGCRVVPTVKTAYATFSLLRAQRQLFQAALADEHRHSAFVLVSGDAVPCSPPAAAHASLLRGSVLRLCRDSAERQRSCDLAAWPEELPWRWVKHSQWVALLREDVLLLEERWPLLEAVFGASTTPDEHAYGVLLQSLGSLQKYPNRASTEALWSGASPCPFGLVERRHPLTVHLTDPHTSALLRHLRSQGTPFLRKTCAKDAWSWPLPLPGSAQEVASGKSGCTDTALAATSLAVKLGQTSSGG